MAAWTPLSYLPVIAATGKVLLLVELVTRTFEIHQSRTIRRFSSQAPHIRRISYDFLDICARLHARLVEEVLGIDYAVICIGSHLWTI